MQAARLERLRVGPLCEGYIQPVRKRIACIAMCLALVGCGSSSGGTDTLREPLPSRVEEVQTDLVREYGLREPRCEQDTRGGSSSRFICLFDSTGGIELQLSVTQAGRRGKLVVTGCEGTRKIRGRAFVTCAVAGPSKPGRKTPKLNAS